VQHSTNQAPRVRQNARVTNQSGSRNSDHCNRPDVLHKEEEPSREAIQEAHHDGGIMAVHGVVRGIDQWMMS
jgi:hypothetical protein